MNFKEWKDDLISREPWSCPVCQERDREKREFDLIAMDKIDEHVNNLKSNAGRVYRDLTEEDHQVEDRIIGEWLIENRGKFKPTTEDVELLGSVFSACNIRVTKKRLRNLQHMFKERGLLQGDFYSSQE